MQHGIWNQVFFLIIVWPANNSMMIENRSILSVAATASRIQNKVRSRCGTAQQCNIFGKRHCRRQQMLCQTGSNRYRAGLAHPATASGMDTHATRLGQLQQ
jgi:hypothetical protein